MSTYRREFQLAQKYFLLLKHMPQHKLILPTHYGIYRCVIKETNSKPLFKGKDNNYTNATTKYNLTLFQLLGEYKLGLIWESTLQQTHESMFVELNHDDKS